MRFSMVVGAWALCFGALLGCGGGDDGDGNGDGNGVGTYCQRWADIFCTGEADCCAAPGRDMAACLEAAQRECVNEFHLDEVAMDPIVGFNASATEAAMTEFENRVSTCDPTVRAWAFGPSGFQNAFDGTRAAGADCTPPNDLGSSQTEIGAALASCQNVATTACQPIDPTWVCQARSAVDGVCFTDLNCVDGLYCAPGQSTFEGICTARLAAGEACTENNECASLVCSGDVCVEGDVQAAYCP